MSVDDARTRLAQSQAELLEALVAGGSLPTAFDADRLTAMRHSLRQKRLRVVARAWPGLIESETESAFLEYAERVPPPQFGGPLADGRRFLATLTTIPERVRSQMLGVDLRFKLDADGLHLRRWPSFRMTRLSEPRRLVIGLRLPWMGERWWTVRL